MEHKNYYLDNGFVVFTEKFLLDRGFCCHNGCRHCPYKNKPMNKVTYKNRYKDEIAFEHIGDEVIMTGGKWIRWAYEEDGTVTMVDPSGGPYIEIGNNLNGFWPKGEYKDLIVDSITIEWIDDEEAIIHFKIK